MVIDCLLKNQTFNMQNCKVVCTQSDQNVELSSDNGTREVIGTLYKNMMGSLNYFTTKKIEIPYLINILSIHG